MSTTTITKCDECGKPKGEVNHWFRAWVPKACRKIVVASASEEVTQDVPATVKDYCGAECAGKAFQRFLASGKLEE